MGKRMLGNISLCRAKIGKKRKRRRKTRDNIWKKIFKRKLRKNTSESFKKSVLLESEKLKEKAEITKKNLMEKIKAEISKKDWKISLLNNIYRENKW